MKTLLSLLSIALLGASSCLMAEEKDPFVGYYVGSINGAPRYPINSTKFICAEVFRDLNGYRIRFMPEILNRCETFKTFENLKSESGAVAFNDMDMLKSDKGPSFRLEGKVLPDSIEAKGKMDGKDVVLNLKRSNYVSPTLNNPPPPNAVVLFDGTGTSQWEQKDGSPCKWTFKDGTISANITEKDGKKIRSGDLYTKQSFGPVRLHLEFRIPPSYDCPLYNRGNSGLYFGDYEIQIIDSFGGAGDWGDCGAIYRIRPPHVNASLEPGAWQTYDVEFRPAQFEGERIVKFPTITVYHNGIRVQNEEPVYWPTKLHFPSDYNKLHSAKNYKIMLQDHGFPVEYRNIWLVNL